ncbi:hypothetical protein BDV36DRAFT_196193 [Aspergillus pseudocaelatus]|uniref:Uncharacterized protein n=1 Tax=Aspergillus pseudocaelatus TaxID=1825620 RepID=A0ABQ6WIG0_9EURO|nr:hypothetical protein BDV36DRAFT_196193 [Aspergillus pseudocaelatus]
MISYFFLLFFPSPTLFLYFIYIYILNSWLKKIFGCPFYHPYLTPPFPTILIVSISRYLQGYCRGTRVKDLEKAYEHYQEGHHHHPQRILLLLQHLESLPCCRERYASLRNHRVPAVAVIVSRLDRGRSHLRGLLQAGVSQGFGTLHGLSTTNGTLGGHCPHLRIQPGVSCGVGNSKVFSFQPSTI